MQARPAGSTASFPGSPRRQSPRPSRAWSSRSFLGSGHSRELRDCRIFQDMTVPEIITKVFRDRGFSDFEDKLGETYDKWTYCVQYRETDFNFISRLMERKESPTTSSTGQARSSCRRAELSRRHSRRSNVAVSSSGDRCRGTRRSHRFVDRPCSRSARCLRHQRL